MFCCCRAAVLPPCKKSIFYCKFSIQEEEMSFCVTAAVSLTGTIAGHNSLSSVLFLQVKLFIYLLHVPELFDLFMAGTNNGETTLKFLVY